MSDKLSESVTEVDEAEVEAEAVVSNEFANAVATEDEKEEAAPPLAAVDFCLFVGTFLTSWFNKRSSSRPDSPISRDVSWQNPNTKTLIHKHTLAMDALTGTNSLPGRHMLQDNIPDFAINNTTIQLDYSIVCHLFDLI